MGKNYFKGLGYIINENKINCVAALLYHFFWSQHRYSIFKDGKI